MKEGIKNFMEVQRQMLDIAGRENSIVEEGLEPAFADTPVNSLSKVVHQGLDNFVTTQKEFLTIIETQATGAMDEMAEGKRPDTGRLMELAREGTRTFLESQKKFLDIVEVQLTAKQSGAEASTNGRSVDIFDMAKKSVDALIEAQQRLLDLASAQVKVNVQFVQNICNVEVRPATISEVVKKSVDSFVAAQKALVDLASKPRKVEDCSTQAAA
jgi:hypothetical protein